MQKKSKVWGNFIQTPEFGVILGIIGFLIILALVTRGQWFTSATIKTVLKSTATIGLITIGQALLIIGGEFDLSVGSVYAFTGLVYVWLIRVLPATGISLGPWHAFLIVLILGLAIGFFNGILVTKMEIPSLIVTLGSMFVFRGLAMGVGKGWGLPFPNKAQMTVFGKIFGGSYPLGFNVSIFWLILLTIIFFIVLSYTRYGNRLQAVGKDPITALSLGISPKKTKIIVFLICAALATFAAILSAPEEGYVYASAGKDFPLESVAAAVLGGCIIGGGIGSIWGAVLGVFLLSSVRTGLIMMGAPPYWYVTFVGIVLILMMAIKSFRKESFQNM